MSAIGLPLPATAAPPAAASAIAPCFHCGSRTDPPLLRRVDGRDRPFCCDGCAAAAQWIETARLGDYYRLRSAAGSRVDAQPGDFAGWDDADLHRDQVRVLEDGHHEITVVTDGMRCAACAWLIDRALAASPACGDVSANAVTGRIRIEWDPAETRLSRLLRGSPRSATARASPARRATTHGAGRAAPGRAAPRRRGTRQPAGDDVRRGAVPRHHREMPLATRDFFRWITFLVATPWCSTPAGRSSPAPGANCATARPAWTRWSPSRRCWPTAPAWSRRCAAGRTSGTTRR
jgi:P-type Cu2+ transporter